MHHKKQKNIGRMFLSLLQNTLSLFKSIVVPLEQTRSNFVFFFFFFSRDKKPFKFLSLKANRPREASSSKSAREMASLRNGQRNGTSLINWTSCVGSRPTKIPVATISSHHRSSLREEECNRDPKSSDFEIARGPSTPLRHHFRWFSHLFAKSCSTLKSHVFSSWAQINLRLFGLLVLLFFFFFNKSKK